MLYSKFLFLLIFSLNLYSNSLAVIVSKESNIDSISKKDLSRIFLSKTKRFPSGEKSIAIELSDEKYQSVFYKKISNKNLKQLKKYWSKMIFTGVGMPPKKIDSIPKLISFIKTNPNAISYIPLERVTNTTKIIMEIK